MRRPANSVLVKFAVPYVNANACGKTDVEIARVAQARPIAFCESGVRKWGASRYENLNSALYRFCEAFAAAMLSFSCCTEFSPIIATN